jgi:hypothetical protein
MRLWLNFSQCRIVVTPSRDAKSATEANPVWTTFHRFSRLAWAKKYAPPR